MLQFGIELSVELVVVDVPGVVDLVGIDADEAARACGIDEWTAVVGRGDERGKALAFLHRLAVGWAELHVALREQVLQDRLLTF